MENASKALIIAGAILIAILLISVGILVMNSVNKPLDAATGEADSQAVQMYNAKFTNYAGSGKTATEVRQLLTLVETNNSTDKKHYIDVTYKVKGTNVGLDYTTNARNGSNNRYSNLSIGDIINKIEKNKNYKIILYYAEANGKYKGSFSYSYGNTEKGYLAFIRIINQDDASDEQITTIDPN